MERLLVLFSMLFLHIVDDYYLQGILAKMKQKKWWVENAPDKLYENDYIMALVMHSLSWSFMISIPLVWWNGFELSWVILIMFFINAIAHGIIDHLKANCFKINLVEDQTLHLSQITMTALIVTKFGEWHTIVTGFLYVLIFSAFVFLLTTDRRTKN